VTRDAQSAADIGPRQERFVEEYLVDLNAKQAAIRAGYSPKTAEVQGSRLLSNVKVQRAIAIAKAERSKRAEVAADRVLLELARVGFSDLRRVFDNQGRLRRPEEWDDDTAAAISSVKVVTRNRPGGEVEYVHEIKLCDKVKALEQTCKHLGLYRDQGQPERPSDSLFPDMTDEEILDRLLENRARRAKWLAAKERGRLHVSLSDLPTPRVAAS
jgi:phage terminase small subunit